MTTFDTGGDSAAAAGIDAMPRPAPTTQYDEVAHGHHRRYADRAHRSGEGCAGPGGEHHLLQRIHWIPGQRVPEKRSAALGRGAGQLPRPAGKGPWRTERGG